MARKEDIEAAYETLGIAPPEPVKMTILVKQKGSFLFVCSWGIGDEVTMGTRKEIKKTINDMLTRSYDEAYDMQIVNINTGKEVTWHFDVTVNIT